jgi:hypothetical protein
MDMGHYRKILVRIEGVDEPLKAYLAKSIPVSEQETITLSPLRYLIYQNGGEPLEMKQNRAGDMIVFGQ